MKTNHTLFLMLAAALAGCASDDENGQDPAQERLPLTIEVAERPLVSPEAQARPTRAAITTTSTLSAFDLNYMYGSSSKGSTTAKKDGDGKWTSDGSWPFTTETVSWYASSDGHFYLTDDANKNPYVSFTVDESAASQKDLLVATATGTRTSTGGKLSFIFDHVCTALRFHVKKAKNMADYTMRITSVKLCNVVRQGQYFYGTSSWTLGSPRSSYTLYAGSAKTLSQTDYEALDTSDGPYLFLIPQTLTAWDTATDIGAATAQTYLQIDCTIAETSTSNEKYSGTAYIPFAATLAAGYLHDVKVNIGMNSLYSSANTKIFQ